MKIKFIDGYSIHDRPPVEREFKSKTELDSLLSEFGGYKYAYSAEIYFDDGSLMMVLRIGEWSGWTV